jgi:type IV secretory pathway VirB6-like protein
MTLKYFKLIAYFIFSLLIGHLYCSADPNTVNPAITSNCATAIACKDPSINIGSADIISENFYSMIKKGFSISSLGNANQEGVYVTCNNTSNGLQACLYQGAFTTTESYQDATSNPNIPALDSNRNTIVSNGITMYCPLTRCDVVTNDIWAQVTYNNVTTNIVAEVGGPPVEWEYSTATGIGSFRAIQIGNPAVGESVCLAIQAPKGYAYIGCKSPSQPNTPSGKIACTASVSNNSQAFFSITGRVVECMQDQLQTVFSSNSEQSGGITIFQKFQIGMQNIVQVALILYVIVFGIHIVIGSEVPKRSEVLMFLMKMILVLYFSVGLTVGNDTSSGIVDYVYPFLLATMNAFSDYLLLASNSQICYYDPSSYNPGYAYLSLWDALDCRAAYYLGFYSVMAPNYNGLYGMISLIFPAFFAMKFLFVVFIICLGVFLLSIMVYFVNIYILAMLGLTIMAYLAPIFVPCALFEKTKIYFDTWLKLLMSYTLQPVVITAFLAIMMSVFDYIIYDSCPFTETTLGSNPAYPYWTISTNPTPSESCQNSFGYQLNNNANTTTINALFFTFTIFDVDMYGPFFTGVLQATLFAFIFYYFAQALGDFAAEITGGNPLSSLALDPLKVAAEVAKRVAKAVLTKNPNAAVAPEGVKAIQKK